MAFFTGTWHCPCHCDVQEKIKVHEMSLAEGVLQLVEDTARRENAWRVTRVVLEIGRLSAVMPDALSFCFAAVARGTLAADARLEITEIPGTAWCESCAVTVTIDALYDVCPACGAAPLQATGGTAMRVKAIEIE